MTRTTSILLVGLLVLFCGSATGSRKRDQVAAIDVIQHTTASQLEEGLPSEPITAWLAKLFNATVTWDFEPGCGDPNHKHDDRICVSTTIPFNRDLEAIVFVDVGPVGRPMGPARLDLAFWQRNDGSHYHEVQRLSEFPEIVKRTK